MLILEESASLSLGKMVCQVGTRSKLQAEGTQSGSLSRLLTIREGWVLGKYLGLSFDVLGRQ